MPMYQRFISKRKNEKDKDGFTSVKKISFDKRIVDDVTVRSINAFIMAYAFIFAISMLLISFDCSSFEEVFTSVLTTMNNVIHCVVLY